MCDLDDQDNELKEEYRQAWLLFNQEDYRLKLIKVMNNEPVDQEFYRSMAGLVMGTILFKEKCETEWCLN
jgi:hypothetical protein